MTFTFTPESNIYTRVTISCSISRDGRLTETVAFPVILSPPGSGNALDFDGSDDYIDLPDDTYFNGDFTVETWVYYRSYQNWDRIIDFGNGESSNNIVIAPSNGSQYLVFQIYNGATATEVISPEKIPLNQWVHIAATSTSNVAKLYINGRLVVTNNSMNQALNVTRTNAYIAKSNWSADPYSNMILDEFRIWNVGRTQSEIRQSMCQKLSGNETGLVLYFNFDNTSGSTVHDLSGNDRHGTLINMQNDDWITSTAPLGDISVYDYNEEYTYSLPGGGRALNFDHFDDYVNLGNRSELILGNVFTIEAWIYPTPSDSNYYGIIGNQTDINTTETRSPSLWVNSYSNIHFDSYATDNSRCFMDSTMVTSNQWNHIAVVYDGTTLNVYANGNAEYTSTACSGYNLKDIPINYIGKVNDLFQGNIDEVRLWTVARTASQIQNNMNAKLLGNETGLVAYYRFDSTSGTTLYDSTANNFDGTLVNMDSGSDWVVSGVQLNDANTYAVSLTVNNRATITAQGYTGTFDSIHLYSIKEAPNVTTPPYDWSSIDTTHYFGVFTAGDTETYSLSYNYTDHPDITEENSFILAYRSNNADASWKDFTTTLNAATNQITKTNISTDTASEFILGLNYMPSISTSVDQSTNEDECKSFTLTVTDTETADCSFSVSSTSSNESLVSSSSITYTCSSGIYTFSLTPIANQYGVSVIGITITDAGGLYSSTSFSLTVVSMNDTPVMGTIERQSIEKNTAIHSLNLTATDVETAVCSMTLTYSTSDTSFIPMENISYTCGAGGYYLSFTPITDQTGLTTISLTLTDVGGLTATQSFIIEVSDPPILSTISDQNSTANTISFTVVDAQGGDIRFTAISSDQTILPYTGINLCGSNSNVITQTFTANISQNLSLTFSPYADQHDRITITVVATEFSGLTTSTSFSVIVSPPGPGNRLLFGGTDDYVSFGSISGSHPLGLVNTSFTISFWLYPYLTGDTYQRIIDKGVNGLTHYALYLHSDGLYRTKINGSVDITVNQAVEAEVWHHFTLTSDANVYTCYINGSQVNITHNPYQSPTNASGYMSLGRSYDIADRALKGSLDEFSIWNRVLSQEEIRQNMCQKLTGSENGLLAYYRFDHSSGTLLRDLAGNGYDGTLKNMEETDWGASSIPLGDSSVYDYMGTIPGDFSVSLSHANGDAFTAVGDGGSYSGIHMYLVNESPNVATSPSSFQSMDTSHYFGVFPIGSSTTYSITYYYGNNTYTNEDDVILAFRENNADTDWDSLLTILDTQTKKISCPYISIYEGYPASEFIFGTEANNLMTDDVVAYYPFNTNANDETGNGNNGDIFGARLVQDRNGLSDGAYQLDGSDDWIRLQDFYVPETFSVSMWLDIQNTTDNQCFVGKTNTSESNFLFMGLFNGGKYHLGIRGTTNSYGASTPGYQFITFVIEKIDASNSLVTFYVDQSIKWQQIINDTMGTIDGNKWSLGQDWDSGPTKTDFFKGILDEVIFYNRALNANEVRHLYNLQPTLSAIDSPTYVSDTVTLTITTEESTQITVIARSSDQTIIPDNQINLGGSGSNQLLVNTNASTPTAVTLTMTKTDNMYGRVIITCSVIGTSGLTETRNFPIIISPPGSGMALDFDGTNDYVDLGSINGSDPLALTSGVMTFSFWVKPALTGNATQRIIDKATAGYGQDGYGISILTTGKLQFYTNDATRLVTLEGTVKANIWQHIAITSDGTTCTCFINGYTVPVTYPNSYGPPPATTTNARIGDAANLDPREFTGLLDEFSIWSRSLTQNEIRQNMCQRLTGTENGLLAYYRFDRTAGTVLSDLSGNGYHGTLTNMSDSDWITSGAALGDVSIYDYSGSTASDFMVNLSHADGDSFTVTGDGGTYTGIHLYLVNESPNITENTTGYITDNHYWGVFPVGTDPTYELLYHYEGNTSIALEDELDLLNRFNNSDPSWAISQSSTKNITDNTFTQTGISAISGISQTEYSLLSIIKNYAPVISEVSPLNTFSGTTSFTCTDAKGGQITLTVQSSDETILPYTRINLAGTGTNTQAYSIAANAIQSITLTFTPVSYAHKRITLTIISSDEQGLTSLTQFAIINSPPGSGNALDFDGNNQYIDLGQVSGSDPLGFVNSAFTFSFWIKPDISGNDYQRIIDKSATGLDHYTLYLHTDGLMRFKVDGSVVFSLNNPLESGIWQHFTITSDASIYTCYVNGILADISANTYASPTNAQGYMSIANSYNKASTFYNGQLDEICIWNISLSQDQIRQYMCQKLTGNEDGLLAYYRFDHEAGTTFTDVSGNNYHGTLTNMSDSNWLTSGAAIGDVSVFDYDGINASDFRVNISHANGDSFTATGDGGTYSSIHLYLVNEAPNVTTQPNSFQTMDTTHYFGVFTVGNSPTYSITYHYASNTYATENEVQLAFRENNADTDWYSLLTILNTTKKTLNCPNISMSGGYSASEFIFGTEPINLTTDDLIAWYPFNGNFNDVSGNGYHGDLESSESNPRCVSDHNGVSDSAYILDGANDWIRLQDFNVPETFTVSSWLYFNDTGSSQCFIGKYNSTGDTNIFLLGYYNDVVTLYLRNIEYGFGTLSNGYHFIHTVVEKMDSSNSRITIYIDQTILWQTVMNDTIGDPSGFRWTVGQDWDASSTKSDFFKGKFDDVTFYNRAISPSEIRYLYHSAPVFSNIESPSSPSDTITLTITTAEATQLTIISRSSDQTILSDNQINLEGTGSNQIVVNTTASTPMNITLTMTPENNRYGRVLITCAIINATGLTETTLFPVIVSPPGSGMALDFPGTNEYISLGLIDNSDPIALVNSEFTFSLWIKPDLTGDSYQRIIDKTTSSASQYALLVHTDGLLELKVNGISKAKMINPVEAGVWQHFAITSDGSSYTCYLNGIQASITSSSYESPADQDGYISIGKSYRYADRIFNGQLDDVQIWNKRLTQDEIRQHMCQKISGNESGLLAYYPFDQNFGTTLNDISGNGYHGTFTNMSESSWLTSGAAIGDVSVYDYSGVNANDFSVNLSYANSDSFTATGDDGTFQGLHLYLVNEAPNVMTKPGSFAQMDTSHYYGVFPVGENVTYSITYNYTNNDFTDQNLDQLAFRANNADMDWSPLMTVRNTDLKTISCQNISYTEGYLAGEFIYGTEVFNLSTSDVIAHYPFNGNILDESGNGNDGDLLNGGMSITSDRNGNANSAYQLDGSDDFITLTEFNIPE
ncbi:MAG: hypothetical protein OMM_08141, partial [Candidatus Magnetoglobus multicellularis str. Araruama]